MGSATGPETTKPPRQGRAAQAAGGGRFSSEDRTLPPFRVAPQATDPRIDDLSPTDRRVGASSALDGLLSSGTIDERQHAAGLAYGALRRRFEHAGGPLRSWKDTSGMSDEAWRALKREHARLMGLVGAERWPLDRLCLDGEAPMACEVERVVEALGRVAETL